MSFARSFDIAGRRVGAGAPCLVIAEAGVAHFGSVDKAFALVDLAVSAKADVVKFQHFRADRLIGPSAPEWRDRLASRQLSDADMARVAAYCREKGILYLCTGHDEAAVDFLDRTVGVAAFKVGSGEVENWPYLASLAKRGKPIFLSTGMYAIEQVRQALAVIAAAGGREVAVLHCVTAYPVDPADVNLAVMAEIRSFFEGPVGYSDHTAGTAVPLAAVALGAEVLEKHITIDRDVPNAQDWKVSCDPSNLAKFVADLREVEAARGGGPKRLAEAEKQSILWARKSLTAASDLPAGTVLAAVHLIAQRPGDGIPPSQAEALLGRRLRQAVPSGTKLAWDMVETR